MNLEYHAGDLTEDMGLSSIRYNIPLKIFRQSLLNEFSAVLLTTFYTNLLISIHPFCHA
jgi:hypothetical protein